MVGWERVPVDGDILHRATGDGAVGLLRELHDRRSSLRPFHGAVLARTRPPTRQPGRNRPRQPGSRCGLRLRFPYGGARRASGRAAGVSRRSGCIHGRRRSGTSPGDRRARSGRGASALRKRVIRRCPRPAGDPLHGRSAGRAARNGAHDPRRRDSGCVRLGPRRRGRPACRVLGGERDGSIPRSRTKRTYPAPGRATSANSSGPRGSPMSKTPF